MKKCLFTILSCLVCGLSLAQGITTIDGVKYYLDNGEATILEQDATLAGNIVIPEKLSDNVADYTVTSMTDMAFAYTAITGITLPGSITALSNRCFEGSKLESIVVPDNITYVGSNCFVDCNNLKSVILPNSITLLGEGSLFGGCKSLESVKLPDGITSLDNAFFQSCSSLKSVDLPNGVTSLGDLCFYECSSLSTIDLPENITHIGERCFEECTSLESITLPGGITSLERESFYNCKNLKSATLPNGITSLGTYCFSDCDKLESVNFPASLIELRDYCFYKCASLKSITLPDGIKYLGGYCFSGCKSITSITLPNSITEIGISCFSSCTSLLSVTCKWENLDNLSANGLNIFYGTPEEIVLNVPKGTGLMYATTSPWKDFTTINEVGNEVEKPVKCATPAISYTDGKLVFTCETEGAEYHYSVTSEDFRTNAYSQDGTVELTAAYNISVYASADGCTNSDEATATLYFIKAGSGTGVGVSEIFAEERGVVLAADGQTVTASGLADGEAVSLYTTDGMLLSTAKASADGIATLDTKGERGVLIVKVGNDGLKIAVN